MNALPVSLPTPLKGDGNERHENTWKKFGKAIPIRLLTARVHPRRQMILALEGAHGPCSSREPGVSLTFSRRGLLRNWLNPIASPTKSRRQWTLRALPS